MPTLAAIDAGGTTFKCALIQEGRGIIAGVRIPTTQPEPTLRACAQFFKEQKTKGLIASSMGIASFGPIDVDPNSSSYGMILDGPKLGWAATNLKDYFEQALSIPVAIDTDVNGALLAEMEWGAAKGAPHLIGNVRHQYAQLMNNYLGQSKDEIDNLIVTPGLGDDAGLLGGACLAKL